MAMRWYIIQVHSNFEKKVEESIKDSIERENLSHLFEKVLVPIEKVVEVKRGKRIDSERKFFPGYILVRMELTKESYHVIQSNPKVTGFLGSDISGKKNALTGAKPLPISDAEAAKILNQVEEGASRPKPTVSFEIGENVRVCEGPFASFSGQVQEVDEERSRLKVEVSIFGRATPVELEYGQVEKV